MHTLKKFDAVRAPAHNYFNHKRHLVVIAHAVGKKGLARRLEI